MRNRWFLCDIRTCIPVSWNMRSPSTSCTSSSGKDGSLNTYSFTTLRLKSEYRKMHSLTTLRLDSEQRKMYSVTMLWLQSEQRKMYSFFTACRGSMHGGGACMAEEHGWQGVCVGGEGGCAGETATEASSTHPTGMYSCYG